MTSVDATDARILLALDDDPEATVLALAGTLGLARNTVHARLRRLRESGALGAPSRRVEAAALGYPLLALVTLSISQAQAGETTTGIAAIPEVVEVLATTGDGDLLARVVARDTRDLHRVGNLVLAVPGVLRSSTVIVLEEVLPATVVPLLRRAAEGTR